MNTTYKLAGRPFGLVIASLMFFSAGSAYLHASDAKFEAQLIWATNDKKCDDPKLKPVDTEVRKKLAELPLKWENYFAVKRDQFNVVKGSTNSVVLSEKCTVEVKRLGDKKVEVSLHGQKGNLCYKRTQPLPKGEMLVLGGNAPNATAWLVTLKRVE
jgi:hypothetical protein